MSQFDQAELCTSIIVACELRFGAEKKASPLLTSKINSILDNIDILPLGENVDKYYATVRNQLEKIGRPIGPNDLLIAAHGLALELTVVTANIAEFSRVPGLQVENWLQQE